MNNQLKAKDGDDVLIGGLGNDTLYGSYGSDTYLFSRGHGHDVIEEYDDSTPTKHDRIVFSDVAYSEVKFRREGDDLLLFGYSETDSLRLKDFYYSARYEVEEFVFTDRSLSLATMREEGIHFVGTSGDDVMTDWKDAEAKSIFEGGLGNDTLKGSYGDDTYLFSRGHGHDVIEEYDDSTPTKHDRIVFSDVAYSEVKFRREGDDLLLFGYSETDSLRLKDFYYSARYEVEEFVFTDRSLSLATMREEGIRLFGAEGNDTIKDWSGNARIDGGLGDDIIFANAGDDVLIGGLGNDTLKGSYGSDTYLFSRGHGQDILEEYSSNNSDIDVIRFLDINNPEKLWFSRKDNHLLITNLDTSDTVTVNYWYSSQKYQVERIELGDGRSLDPSQVDKLVSAMAAFEALSSSDTLSVQQDEMKRYMSTLAVTSHYS
ncbi:Cyclolysin [Pasteurella multocida]|nr:Cyclolysin [Pasteurella multocida]